MKYILIFLVFISVNLLAKKDFFYSYINSSGYQISEQRKQEIIDGYDTLNAIRELVKEGQIGEAYSWIKEFSSQNKLKLLKSDIILLQCEILLKKDAKRFVLEGARELEKAINSSVIHEEDLPNAYMLLVDLKLESNRVNDAVFFAKKLINTYSDPKVKAYGNIYLAKIYERKREYGKATKILYEILTKTTDLTVATIVADKLFDIYVADNKRDKAYELIAKVLEQNIDFYANDSYIALKKVDKLLKADMPEFSIKILQELLKKATQPESIEDFKFKLANTYMDMFNRFDKKHKNMQIAKELYKDLLNDFPRGTHVKKAKMYLDEIIMREGKIEPAILASKYKDSESMMQKVLLQELLNDKKNKRYTLILKQKKIYKKISDTIAQRFGYKDMAELFDEVNILMIKDYLNSGQCSLMNKALASSRRETLQLLIEDDTIKFKFFECLIEVPYERAYKLAKNAFYKSRDAAVYLHLERMAYSLGLIDDAYDFSLKIDMIDDKEILRKEFLYRFLVYGKKSDSVSMEKFFLYTTNNEELIKANDDNPLIIDFYYQYYLYLVSKEDIKKSREILNKLYQKQKEFKAYVYSPFVEMELASIQKEQDDFKGALEFLEEALKSARSIKNKDLAKLYYETAKLYEILNNKDKYSETVLKCQELTGIDDDIYKNMCDKL